jgi:phosphomannomutase
MSGHIFFKERWFGFDDGTYAGCRLLEILSRSADPSAVLNALPTSTAPPS